MKRVDDLSEREQRRQARAWTVVYGIITALVVIGFLALLFFGFDSALGLLRYRVALFLLLIPLIGLFLWSAYQTFFNKPR